MALPRQAGIAMRSTKGKISYLPPLWNGQLGVEGYRVSRSVRRVRPG